VRRVARKNGLVTGLGCDTNDAGFVTVDATGQTNIRGVWATGTWSIPAPK
jgi:thioredoxin reductase